MWSLIQWNLSMWSLVDDLSALLFPSKSANLNCTGWLHHEVQFIVMAYLCCILLWLLSPFFTRIVLVQPLNWPKGCCGCSIEVTVCTLPLSTLLQGHFYLLCTVMVIANLVGVK